MVVSVSLFLSFPFDDACILSLEHAADAAKEIFRRELEM